MSSTTPADSAHDRNQQGGDVRHHVYGWLCRHLRDLYRIQPSALDLSPGDPRGRFSVEASPQRRAMYWYGWLLTALIGATILALATTVTPERWMQRGITFGVLAAVGYLIVYSVALFIYDKATIELEFLKSRWLSAIAAIVLAAAVSLFTPTSWNERVWPGWVWVVPIGAMAVLGYYLTPYFTR